MNIRGILVAIVIVALIVIFVIILSNGRTVNDTDGDVEDVTTADGTDTKGTNGDDVERYSCESNEDCVKYNHCSEDCVNSDWLENNPYSGVECAAPWMTECQCINNECTG